MSEVFYQGVVIKILREQLDVIISAEIVNVSTNLSTS